MKKLALISLSIPLLSGCFISTSIVGNGKVTSTGGHDCGVGTAGVCTVEYDRAGTEIFTAEAEPGSMLSKWSACDPVTLETCAANWSQAMADQGVLGQDTLVVEATFRESNPPVKAAQYTYNALGQRMTKKVDGRTTVFQYDLAGNLMGEYSASGAPLRQYVHVDGEPIAQVSTNLSGKIAVQYVHVDHLGTPTLLTDQRGTVVADIEATPFGETFIDYAAVTHNRRFPGQYRDDESGLHHNYYRDYDPRTGRYIQSDPSGLNGGVNTYLYAQLNPLIMTDPFGLRPIPSKPWTKEACSVQFTVLDGFLSLAGSRYVKAGFEVFRTYAEASSAIGST